MLQRNFSDGQILKNVIPLPPTVFLEEVLTKQSEDTMKEKGLGTRKEGTTQERREGNTQGSCQDVSCATVRIVLRLDQEDRVSCVPGGMSPRK